MAGGRCFSARRRGRAGSGISKTISGSERCIVFLAAKFSYPGVALQEFAADVTQAEDQIVGGKGRGEAETGEEWK